MSQKHKIAVIEDDTPICNLYKMKLELSGYEVKTAIDGQQGYELVESFEPDLILLDLKMPVMTGDEMLEKIRSTEWGSKPRVVILTNISKAEAPHNLRFLNVDRYVVKAHHTPSQVIDVVKEILN
ncbi:response regulator [Candidatus Saccharibacteria bacterium]|nr:response regulator [Candidatus Saccharibacteria bacterium]